MVHLHGHVYSHSRILYIKKQKKKEKEKRKHIHVDQSWHKYITKRTKESNDDKQKGNINYEICIT